MNKPRRQDGQPRHTGFRPGAAPKKVLPSDPPPPAPAEEETAKTKQAAAAKPATKPRKKER